MPLMQDRDLRHMELTRRQFGLGLLASALGFLTGAWKFAGSVVRAGFVRAVKTKCFPGKLIPLDSGQVGQAGKWSG
jgi:hypothetical protein